ncbi:hypothetical protein, partial [Escherichia coli]|uniref:hypothetical protein n=1 Tax=Escherichia coli TaxID=562 RepID=UPI00201F1DED
SDGNGSHASTLKSPSYTKSVSWQHYQENQNKRSGESQAIVDARQFFSEHPEYISSAELEQKLYREFAQVTTVPAYKEMSMYQLLVIS